MDVVVATEADLNRLRTRDRSAIRRIRLAGPLADARLERDLNRAYFACGCAAGAIAVSLTLCACLILGLLAGFEAGLAWWRILLYLVAASVGGKLAGLLLARFRLRRLLHRLSAGARGEQGG